MSKVAILIPTYKPAGYVKLCFQSIEEQTLSKEQYKVYIALNGPKENYIDFINLLLKSFSFEYEFFYLAEAGVSNARNFLIENSIEPFIAFVDDDDLISNNYLESLLSVTTQFSLGVTNINNFIKNIDEAVAANVTNQYLENKKVEKIGLKTRKFFSNPCAKLMHRNMLENIRFDTRLKIGEDSLFMAKVSRNIINVVKSGDNVFYYANLRQGSASRSHVDRIDLLKRTAYLSKEYFKLLIKPGYRKAFILSRVAATFIHLKRLF